MLGKRIGFVNKQIFLYKSGDAFRDKKGRQTFCADEVRARFIEWVIHLDNEDNSPDPDDARKMLIKINGEHDHTKYAVDLTKKTFKEMCY